jgi:uncharacterized membrane protein
MNSVGRIFLAGLLTVLPVLATLYLVLWLVAAMERFFGAQLKWLMPDEYYRTGMGLLLEVPLVRSVYAALRDLFGLVASGQDAAALQVVSVTLPGTNMRAMGFVARREFGDLPAGVGR